MWKLLLKAVKAASANPAVRAWVARKALDLAGKVRERAERRASELTEIAAPPAAEQPEKPIRTLRLGGDPLRVGDTAIYTGKAYRITRVLGGEAGVTSYEAMEV